MIGFGFVENWWTLAILRVPLGAFEGILFPGCIFLISSWYPRYETQKRISAFYLGGQFVSGFGNIIAYGFSCVLLFISHPNCRGADFGVVPSHQLEALPDGNGSL